MISGKMKGSTADLRKVGQTQSADKLEQSGQARQLGDQIDKVSASHTSVPESTIWILAATSVPQHQALEEDESDDLVTRWSVYTFPIDRLISLLLIT